VSHVASGSRHCENWIGEAGEDLRDEEECCNDSQYGEYAQEELHAIAHIQTEIAGYEGENSSWE